MLHGIFKHVINFKGWVSCWCGIFSSLLYDFIEFYSNLKNELEPYQYLFVRVKSSFILERLLCCQETNCVVQ